MRQRNLVIAAGLASLISGIVNGISDYYLQGGFSSGPGVNTFENLETVPFESVHFGSVVGYAALPLWILGLWPLYHNLKPSGDLAALIPVLLLGYALACIPGYHHSYVFYAAGFQSSSLHEDTFLLEQLLSIHSASLRVFQAPLGLACVWIAVLILRGKTRFPRWMFIISPMLTPLTQPLVEILPAPWGAYIRPPWGTAIITLFFAVSLWVYWKHRDETGGFLTR